MLAKLAALMQSKAALAALGIVLLGGGSGAVAVAATTGHLHTLGVNLDGINTTGTQDAHANSVSIEGLLTACNISATPNTISVQDKSGKNWVIVVNADTKLNGDIHTGEHGATSANNPSSATGDTGNKGSKGNQDSKGGNSANTHGGGSTGDTHVGNSGNGANGGSSTGDTHSGDSTSGDSTSGSNTGSKGANSSANEGGSATGSSSNQVGGSSNANTDKGNASDGAHGDHALTLAEVCAAANLHVSDVQAQVTPSGSANVAWKVTLQGHGDIKNGGANTSSSGAQGASSESDQPTATASK